jgi:hypothetical protein
VDLRVGCTAQTEITLVRPPDVTRSEEKNKGDDPHSRYQDAVGSRSIVLWSRDYAPVRDLSACYRTSQQRREAGISMKTQ